MAFIVTNNTHQPSMTGRSMRRQTLTLDGFRIEPARELVFPEITSDILLALEAEQVYVSRNGRAVSLESLQGEGYTLVKVVEPRQVATVDGMQIEYTEAFQIALPGVTLSSVEEPAQEEALPVAEEAAQELAEEAAEEVTEEVTEELAEEPLQAAAPDEELAEVVVEEAAEEVAQEAAAPKATEEFPAEEKAPKARRTRKA
jgi:hypothetical protein